MFAKQLKTDYAALQDKCDEAQGMLEAIAAHMAMIEFQPDGTIIQANGLF